jgi:hypothetical protein
LIANLTHRLPQLLADAIRIAEQWEKAFETRYDVFATKTVEQRAVTSYDHVARSKPGRTQPSINGLP